MHSRFREMGLDIPTMQGLLHSASRANGLKVPLDSLVQRYAVNLLCTFSFGCFYSLTTLSLFSIPMNGRMSLISEPTEHETRKS